MIVDGSFATSLPDVAGFGLALAIAPFIGSFLGVLVERLPRGEKVAVDRSRCVACGGVLGARDLVPLVSYALLRGRCRACGARIDPFHWQIECAAIGAMALALWAGVDWPARIGDAVLFEALLALAWCDLRSWRLPDKLTLPLLLAGLGEAVWQAGGLASDPLVMGRAIGAVVGWALLAGIGLGYRKLRGREGLGGGDAKLLAAGGAWLGWAALGPVLLVGAVATLCVALLARVGGRKLVATSAVPFGPGLALGIVAMRVWMR